MWRASRRVIVVLAVAYLGGVLLAGSWWPLITFALALSAIWGFVIGPEERYLSVRFGQAFVDYCTSTRRWL